MYQLFSDVTADVSAEMMAELPEVKMLSMAVEIGDREYLYGPDGNLSVTEFYALLRAGSFASTSQLTPQALIDAFTPTLSAGVDILYLCFSSGLSGTWQSAQLARDALLEQYPERKVICVDTLCASAGQGFLVRECARKQAEGLDIDALTFWVERRKLSVCHWFTVDSFDHLRHGGRVSGAAAAIGTVMNIIPLLHVDEAGKLVIAQKPRGPKMGMAAQIAHMREGWEPNLGNLVVIAHADSPKAARALADRVLSEFPNADIRFADICPVIGAHVGPGMMALIYWGNNR